MWTRFALVLFPILHINAKLDMKIYPSAIFPHPQDTILKLEISPKTESETLITSVLDTMVVRITDGKQTVIDCAKFTYGKSDFIDNEYKGELLEISSWKRRDNTIKISLLFKTNSNGKQLEIFILRTDSSEKCKKITTNEKKIYFFFTKIIDLTVLFKLDVQIKSLNRTTGELVEGDLAVATCRVLGMSNENPVFLNFKKFKYTKIKLFPEKNERKCWFQVSSSDHEKRLECKIENIITDAEVLVHHGPKEILTNPKNLENVEPGSEINCYAADGYPEPKVQWKFISGPKDFSSYYSIVKNGMTLKLKPGYKTGAELKFQCTAENVILKRKKIISKIISITIPKPIPSQCNIPCLDSRLTLLEGLFQSRKISLKTTSTDFQTKNKNYPDLADIEKLKQEIALSSTGLNRKIKSLKQECDWQFIDINKTLRISTMISESKLDEHSKDLTFLKKSLKNLEKLKKIQFKDQEITTLVNSVMSIKENIEEMQKKHKLEIKELSNEIKSLKEMCKSSTDVRLHTTTPISITTRTPLPNKQYSFKWVVYEIDTKRNSLQNMQSADFYLDRLQIVTYNIEFQDLSTQILLKDIEITLSFMNEKQLEKPVVLVKATVEISNTKNLGNKKSISKNFHINLNYGTSPVFYFRYSQLFNSGILQNGSVTISCFLEFVN